MINKSNFSSKLSNMFNSYTKLSDTIQDLLIFALVTFADSGNTVYVERLLNRPDDSVTWYNFDEVNQAVSTFDLVQIVSTLRKKYKSAKENDKKKVINTVQSEKILQEIDSLLLQLNPIK